MATDPCEISRWETWKRQFNNLPPREFAAQLQANPQGILLDVRTTEEFDLSRLAGATHLNYFDYQLLERIEALDPEATYFVYCRSGRRSIRVCVLLKHAGFQHLVHLDGGIIAWQNADLPVAY